VSQALAIAACTNNASEQLAMHVACIAILPKAAAKHMQHTQVLFTQEPINQIAML